MSTDRNPTQALEGDAALIRAVGSFALAAAVMNIIVGGGIFRMPSALSAQVGIAAPLALVAGALAIIPVALCFAAIGSRAVATGMSYLSARLIREPAASECSTPAPARIAIRLGPSLPESICSSPAKASSSISLGR